MNNVNKTLYIPLFGKAFVSKRGMFLSDKKAEEIWDKSGFKLKGKASSKWLAYYMGIRSAVFDEWARKCMNEHADAIVLHIGCGLDSRSLRICESNHLWFDFDFPEVIEERKKYYNERADYKMISSDVRQSGWLDAVGDQGSAIVIMEGVSMYMSDDELKQLFRDLDKRFEKAFVLMDCYTTLAAKLSKYKNPINTVGVTEVTGIDDPEQLESGKISFVQEMDMTPQKYVDELNGAEKWVFSKLYAGRFSKKLYKLYLFEK